MTTYGGYGPKRRAQFDHPIDQWWQSLSFIPSLLHFLLLRALALLFLQAARLALLAAILLFLAAILFFLYACQRPLLAALRLRLASLLLRLLAFLARHLASLAAALLLLLAARLALLLILLPDFFVVDGCGAGLAVPIVAILLLSTGAFPPLPVLRAEEILLTPAGRIGDSLP